MTPDTLRIIGAALYGPRWQTDLARALDVSDRHMRRWVSGAAPIPEGVRADLLALIGKRRGDLDAAALALG